MRRRTGLSLLAAGVLLAALVWVLSLGRDDLPTRKTDRLPRPEALVQDDAEMLYGTDAEVRQAARTLAALGVDRVRINAGWSGTAPAPHATRRPVFDASDSSAYPPGQWDALDRAVRETVAAGMKPMLDVGFWAPRWAVERSVEPRERQRWAPSPVEFAKFATAVARRYDGSDGRPAVRLYTTWNEPNHPVFLLPQWVRQGGRWVPRSPHVYRAMHERGYAAIKAVSPENKVLVGGLTSLGSRRPGFTSSMPPLHFLREMACVDRALRPLGREECRGFRPIAADGFSHHPYSFTTPPDVPRGGPDSVTMADLDKLTTLLRRLHERGRIAGPLDLWLTEYGYETNPPDTKRGVSLNRQALWMSQATSIALANPNVRSFAQFLLRDIDDARPDPSAGYQTGLMFADGRLKPSFIAFALPLVVSRSGSTLEAVGQVRPGSGRQRVRIERLGPGRIWQPVGASFLTRTNGSFRRPLPRPGTYRFAWEGRRSLPVAGR